MRSIGEGEAGKFTGPEPDAEKLILPDREGIRGGGTQK